MAMRMAARNFNEINVPVTTRPNRVRSTGSEVSAPNPEDGARPVDDEPAALHVNESDEQADAHRSRVAKGLRRRMKNLLSGPDEAEDDENKPGGGGGAQRLLLPIAYPPAAVVRQTVKAKKKLWPMAIG